MEILEDIPLAPYTTFGIGGQAKFFCSVSNKDELEKALDFAKVQNLPHFILGGGSNVLISDDGFSGLVILIQSPGLDINRDKDGSALVTVGAGEIWDHVVAECVQQGLWGIENLSHIPGRSGAFVVQNVGAYGQEASQIVETVSVYDTKKKELKVLNNADCAFSYRKSIFNTTQKGRYVILSISLRLSELPKPNFNYADVANYFSGRQPDTIDQSEIRSAIIQIRNKKFPFPKEAKGGSAGSFFKGPLLDEQSLEQLRDKLEKKFDQTLIQKFNTMLPKLKVPGGYKMPAGFLIEACGLKSFQVGGAKINETQSAVIINATGKATCADVLELYKEVKQTVYNKTGVDLEHEPEFVGAGLEML